MLCVPFYTVHRFYFSSRLSVDEFFALPIHADIRPLRDDHSISGLVVQRAKGRSIHFFKITMNHAVDHVVYLPPGVVNFVFLLLRQRQSRVAVVVFKYESL